MKPRVSNEAYLISIDSCSAFEAKFGIKSSHSFLGISMLAIIATAPDTCFLTVSYGVAN